LVVNISTYVKEAVEFPALANAGEDEIGIGVMPNVICVLNVKEKVIGTAVSREVGV